jgi:hypothetical protein
MAGAMSFVCQDRLGHQYLANIVTIQIDRWNNDAVFTAWSVQAKSRLADLLKTACPAMRQTERKRVAKKKGSVLGAVLTIDTKWK